MLISKKIVAAINGQIGHELSASLQYISMAAYFEAETLAVLAARFYLQADEERDHAMRMVKFILNAGGRVEIPAVSGPRNEFKSPEDAVAQALKWEETVTKQINDLVALSIKESDYLTQNFLSWFVNEQLEEVSSMDTLLKLVRRAGPENLMFVENYLMGVKAAAGASKPDTGGQAT